MNMQKQDHPIVNLPALFQKYGQLGHLQNGKLVFRNPDYLYKKFRNSIKSHPNDRDGMYKALAGWLPDDETLELSDEGVKSAQDQTSLRSLFNQVASLAEEQIPPIPAPMLEKLKTPTDPDRAPIYMARAFSSYVAKDQSAAYQWYMCYLGLKAAGLNVIADAPADLFKDPRGHNLPIFTRDTSIIINDTAYMLSFPQYFSAGRGSKSFRREVVENFYKKQGLTVKRLGLRMGDGGDLVFDPISNTLFAGGRDQSAAEDIESLKIIQNDNPNMKIVPIERRDHRLYHLDTMLAFLPRGEVVLSEAGFYGYDYNVLKQITAGRKIITLPAEVETNPMMCNLVSSENTVVLSKNYQPLKQEIEKCGYDVYSPSDFNLNHAQLHGGGLHCMTNQSLRCKI
jgi:N-dimethylarginine dimethylaminohydrolase